MSQDDQTYEPTAEELADIEAEDAKAADQLERVTKERDEYLDLLQRSRAEFANYRKRTDAERARIGDLVTANTLTQFLPVIDDFDRAVAAVPEADRSGGWMAGIVMIHKKLNGLLERAGVTPTGTVGEAFDPARHEAVSSDPGSSGSHITEVYQKGYELGPTLLRPAMVKTGNPSAEA